MSPKFILRSRAEAQQRHDAKRWGTDLAYNARKSSLERQGLLAWVRLEYSEDLLVANIFPVTGETDLALWRPWQLHVSVAFRGELPDQGVDQLRLAVVRRVFRIRCVHFGCGGSRVIARYAHYSLSLLNTSLLRPSFSTSLL